MALQLASDNTALEFDREFHDPVLTVECVADASREFALDLAHHLNWMGWRSEGADLAEVARIRDQLDAYISSRTTRPLLA